MRLFGATGLFCLLASLLLDGGTLGAQTAFRLNLLSQLRMPTNSTDVWGYVDRQSYREYALIGSGGLVVVDVTDPAQPRQAAHLTTVPWFDIKTWQNYACTVNGGPNGLGAVIDLSNPEAPQQVGTFPSSHNIFIDDRGILYAEIPGLHIYDLRPDPTEPRLLWRSKDNDGHDAAVIGSRLFDFHGYSGTNIYDITDPAMPQLLGAINDPAIQYHHSGWTDKTGRYLFICDELSQHPNPDVTIWDIADPGNPQKVGSIADSVNTVHNLYIIGDIAFVAYYTAGFRVYDVSQPAQPEMVAGYVTIAPGHRGFNGNFGVYPFAASGTLYVSDVQSGLYLFSFTGSQKAPETLFLRQNYPNPFNATTRIEYELPEATMVRLDIFDVLGRRVRTLVDRLEPAGSHRVFWSGDGDNGQLLPSGVYFYELRAGSHTTSRRLVHAR